MTEDDGVIDSKGVAHIGISKDGSLSGRMREAMGTVTETKSHQKEGYPHIQEERRDKASRKERARASAWSTAVKERRCALRREISARSAARAVQMEVGSQETRE
jgi:hypothetical protein